VFVHAEDALNVSFEEAEARLAKLTVAGTLVGVSEGAYDSGMTGLIKVGPLAGAAWASKLVEVRTRPLVRHDDRAMLTLRWEATGSGGGLFPALDADITLSRDGEDSSLLTLDGAYRPPLAALGAGLDRVILNRVATSTVRALLARLADAITAEESADTPGLWPWRVF
jgi:hypothetical protein